jgi:EAL domain-containing protein (putative c-di-GMP-specific phosphodiesterase class I)/CheY-like chemotaxis protein
MTQPADDTSGKSSGPTVLVVDDEAPLRRLLGVALADAGYGVVEARGGRQALDLISHASYDLVLLDVRMPGMSGLEVLRVLRSRPETRALPVIMVTGADEVADTIGGLDAGATDYVVKPFDVEEVLARVRAHLRGQQAWSDVLQAQLRERAGVAEALGRAAAAATPEGMAGVVSEELVGLGSVAGTAVVWFCPDGLTVPLSAAGAVFWGLQVGQPTPAPLGRYLQGRAALGSWLERGELDDTDEATPGALLVSGVVACAPLGEPRRPFGLLMLAAGAEVSAAEATATLAAAVDFGSAIAGLLEAPLAARRAAQARRDGVASVLLDRAFVPHFQPIVTLAERITVGYEALTRFSDLSPPEARFAEAADVGLGLALEQATIAAALAATPLLAARRWIGLNVSADMILATDILGAALEGVGRDIVLEISEHERIDDYDELRAALNRLGVDVLLSVDDAGSGFASLRHILLLRPAFMKLDRSWVHAIDQDRPRQALIAGLHNFAVDTDCRLIAEGVETEAELVTLVRLGVELGQGYLLGRPQPVRS